MTKKNIIKNNEPLVNEILDILKSDVPKQVKDIMILGKIFDMKTDKGKTVGDSLIETFKPPTTQKSKK